MHFYTREGQPAYYQPSGKPMTPGAARKRLLVPSVSEICRLLASPGLERWKRQTPDYKKVAAETASWGSDAHAAIQEYIETGDMPAKWEPWLGPALDALEQVDRDILVLADTEKAFSHPLGFGGKTDLCIDTGDVKIVVDFKTKSFEFEKKKLAYPDNARQLAAYRAGLGMPAARMLNVFISRTRAGVYQIHEWPDKGTYWRQFYYLLKLWQELYYDSSFGD